MFGRKDVKWSGFGDARHGCTRPTLFPATFLGEEPGEHGNTRSMQKRRRQMGWGNYRAAEADTFGAKEKGKALSGEISARVLF
jgi:hypothetical protein